MYLKDKSGEFETRSQEEEQWKKVLPYIEWFSKHRENPKTQQWFCGWTAVYQDNRGRCRRAPRYRMNDLDQKRCHNYDYCNHERDEHCSIVSPGVPPSRLMPDKVEDQRFFNPVLHKTGPFAHQGDYGANLERANALWNQMDARSCRWKDTSGVAIKFTSIWKYQGFKFSQ